MAAVNLFKSRFLGRSLNGNKSVSPWLFLWLRHLLLLMIYFLEIISIFHGEHFLLLSDVASSLCIFSLSEYSRLLKFIMSLGNSGLLTDAKVSDAKVLLLVTRHHSSNFSASQTSREGVACDVRSAYTCFSISCVWLWG